MQVVKEQIKKEITTDVFKYIASDGTVFLSERTCLDYELIQTFPYEVLNFDKNSDEAERIGKIIRIDCGEILHCSSGVWVNLPKGFDKKTLLEYLEVKCINVRSHNLEKNMQGWYLFFADWNNPGGSVEIISYEKLRELLEEEVVIANKTKYYIDNLLCKGNENDKI